MKKYYCLLLALSFALLSGCGGQKKPEGMPDIYPCIVNVIQEQAPLAGAKIVAIPTDKELAKKWSVTGETDEKGAATLVTRGKFKGAPAGEFILVITKDEVEQKEITTDPKAQEKQYSIPKFFSLIDPKSGDEKTTPHKITVEPKKNNSFDIDVGKKVRIEKKMAAA